MANPPHFDIWYIPPSFIYDASYRPIRKGQINLIQQATYTKTRNQPGSFEIVIPWTADTEALINTLKQRWLIEFYMNDVFDFGGYINKIKFSTSGLYPTMTIGGPSYMGYLGQMKMLPTTGAAPVVTGAVAAATAMKNIWTNLLTDTGTRRHPILTWAAAVTAGTKVLSSLSLQPLDSGLEGFQNIAAVLDNDPAIDTTNTSTNGYPRVWFDVIRKDLQTIEPYVWTPRPGVNRAIGTPSPVLLDVSTGNLQDIEYDEDSSNLVNAVYTLWAGDGATRGRTTTEIPSSIGQFGRSEGTVDAGQETDAAVIKQKTTDYLKDKQDAQASIKCTYQSTPDLMYGVHFVYGDRVTVVWPDLGLTWSDDVTSVTVGLASGKQMADVSIVVGSEQMNLADAQRRLGRTLLGLRRAIAYQRH